MPKKATKVRLLTHSQSCRYCHQDFVPTRRGTQQYCSPSCRTTYCRKKKQGTLHRLQRLPGPATSSATSFEKLFLAATAGSLAANATTQTAEYHLVTKDLLAQIAQLQQQLRQQLSLNQQQGQLLVQLQHDQQRLLLALGVPAAAASLPPPAAVERAPGASLGPLPAGAPPGPARTLAPHPPLAWPADELPEMMLDQYPLPDYIPSQGA